MGAGALSGRSPYGWLLLAGAVAALLPLVASSNYYINIGVNALIIVCLAVAFDLVIGRVGALSFAQPVFFGFGMYVAGLFAVDMGLGFWWQVMAAMAGGIVLSLVVGIPSFRLDLHAFAIGTLGFATIAELIALNWMEVTQGPMCVAGIPRATIPLGFTEITANRISGQYYFILGIAAILVTASVMITRRRIGLAFSAVRDDPVLADANGLSPNRLRLIAFGIAAAFSAIVGVFAAQFQTVVCPDSFSTATTVTLLIIAFIGGRASFRGVLIAAVIFTILPQVLRVADEWRMVIFGLLLLLVVLTVPDGIEHMFRRVERWWKSGAKDDLANPNAHVFMAQPLPSYGSHHAVEPIDGGKIVVRGLGKSFAGVTAVNDLSFEVQPGELVGLIGPNGSGKSTSLDCISGLISPDRGHAEIDGNDITGWTPHALAKQGLVRTFQATRVYDTLTVRENLAVAQLGRLPGLREWKSYLRSQAEDAEFAGRADHLIETLNLKHVEHRKAGELSYGQKKLIQFAAALVTPPRVLLLDEPLAGVNPAVINIFKEHIVRFNELGLTIILVEHNLPVVTELCRRLIVLEQGMKIADGDPHSVMTNPRVQEAYLGR